MWDEASAHTPRSNESSNKEGSKDGESRRVPQSPAAESHTTPISIGQGKDAPHSTGGSQFNCTMQREDCTHEMGERQAKLKLTSVKEWLAARNQVFEQWEASLYQHDRFKRQSETSECHTEDHHHFRYSGPSKHIVRNTTRRRQRHKDHQEVTESSKRCKKTYSEAGMCNIAYYLDIHQSQRVSDSTRKTESLLAVSMYLSGQLHHS